MKKCPACAEEIQDEAIKCRFCGDTESVGQEGLNWPGLYLAILGIILLVHSLTLETTVGGTISLELMRHQQRMLMGAVGVLILGALGWLFGPKSPLPKDGGHQCRLASLCGGSLALLAVATPTVDPHRLDNTLMLAVLSLGYGLATARPRLRRTVGVALGVGLTALVLQRSFDDVRAHYVFAGVAAAFTAGLVTYGLTNSIRGSGRTKNYDHVAKGLTDCGPSI